METPGKTGCSFVVANPLVPLDHYALRTFKVLKPSTTNIILFESGFLISNELVCSCLYFSLFLSLLLPDTYFDMA